MITLYKVKEFNDGTANYTFNVDANFTRFYVNQTGDEKPTDEKVGAFIKNLIFEAVGETYTESNGVNLKK
jgi:hypothetical protein